MKLAIMQPYLFPYIGYFQLINAVDKFVVLEDVNFIKKGWINRNKILLNDKDFMFSVPLKRISQNKLITETKIDQINYKHWQIKFLNTLLQAYRRAPNFESSYNLIKSIISEEYITINELAKESIRRIKHYLMIDTVLVESSSIYDNQHLKGQDRIIKICNTENATCYINLIGGKELYSKEEFGKNGIRLKFINSKTIIYNQYNDFIPWLSIIDVIMFNNLEDITKMLNEYEFA